MFIKSKLVWPNIESFCLAYIDLSVQLNMITKKESPLDEVLNDEDAIVL